MNLRWHKKKYIQPAAWFGKFATVWLAVFVSPHSCEAVEPAGQSTRVSQASPAGPPTILRSPPSAVRPQDQVWIINCRGVGSNAGTPNLQQLLYGRFDSQGWTLSNQRQFVLSHKRPFGTIVFVPGNGYSHSQARDLGLQAYQRTVSGLPREAAVRFVIWSWPSDPVSRRAMRDARVKASRTPWAAWCLIHWLDAVEPARSLCLVGTGFGAKIVAEALHLRGGGSLGWYQLATQPTPRPPVRAVLVSAAFDNDWLLPGRRLGRALSSTERMLLITNSTDPVLRRYHWLYGMRSRAAALGYTGLAGALTSGSLASKVEQVDAAATVGANHGFMYYFSVPQVVARIQPYTLEPDVPLLARERRSSPR
jgi:hypothetical protein